jgi:hypothetical protein
MEIMDPGSENYPENINPFSLQNAGFLSVIIVGTYGFLSVQKFIRARDGFEGQQITLLEESLGF